MALQMLQPRFTHNIAHRQNMNQHGSSSTVRFHHRGKAAHRAANLPNLKNIVPCPLRSCKSALRFSCRLLIINSIGISIPNYGGDPMVVKLELYRVFKEVAESGNISVAAKNLYISQSADS